MSNDYMSYVYILQETHTNVNRINAYRRIILPRMASDMRNSPQSPGNSVNQNHILKTALDLLEREGDSYWMRAAGGSMRPLIHEGDLLQIDPTPNNPRRGEIIAFRQRDQLTAHRVLQVTQDSDGLQKILAHGDHALRSDPRIHIEQVVGRVIAIRRGERVMSLETRAWRSAGILLAWLMSNWSAIQSGQQRESTWLDRAIRKGFWGMIRCMQALIGRWEDGQHQS